MPRNSSPAASTTEPETLAREAALQSTLALPAVAPVVEHGVEHGIPHVTLFAPGQPWLLDDGRPLDHAAALSLATQAVRILRALALAGVALPDAAPERFCLTYDRTPSLTLVDLAGASGTTPEDAETSNAASAAALAARLAPAIEPAHDLTALIHTLDRAHMTARRD